MTHLSYEETLRSDYRQVRKRLQGQVVPCVKVTQPEIEIIEEEIEEKPQLTVAPSIVPPMAELPPFTEYLERAEIIGTKVRRYHVMRIGCVYYRCTKDDLLYKKRDKKHVHRRFVLANLMNSLCKSSFPEIARTLGNMDHSTIVHHVRMLKSLEERPSRMGECIEVVRAEMNIIGRHALVYAYTEGSRIWGGSFSQV